MATAERRTERWVRCKTCSALVPIPAGVRLPPVFRARCIECRSEAAYVNTDVFDRPARTH